MTVSLAETTMALDEANAVFASRQFDMGHSRIMTNVDIRQDWRAIWDFRLSSSNLERRKR